MPSGWPQNIIENRLNVGRRNLAVTIGFPHQSSDLISSLYPQTQILQLILDLKPFFCLHLYYCVFPLLAMAVSIQTHPGQLSAVIAYFH